MIEVAKSLIKKNEKYLLLKRTSSSKFFPNLWDFPGGKIEPEEGAKEALIRETKEETSLEIIPEKKIGDFDYTEDDILIHFQIFAVKKYTGAVALSKDHSDSMWFSRGDFKNYDLAPIVKLFFNFR